MQHLFPQSTSNTMRISHMLVATMLHATLTLSVFLRHTSFLACKPKLQDSGPQGLAASCCIHTSAVPEFVAAAIYRSDHCHQVPHCSAVQLFWQRLGPSSPEPRLWPQEWGLYHPVSACRNSSSGFHMACCGQMSIRDPQAESKLQLFASDLSSLQWQSQRAKIHLKDLFTECQTWLPFAILSLHVQRGAAAS